MIEPLNQALEGRYRVERELGAGGMATVYLAQDLKHDRRVALKVLKPELAAVVGAERFLAEIKTTANLQHPHILPLFDSGQADGLVWYTMPYVEGESLRERLDREQQLPVAEAVTIAEKVAGALQAAHERGIVHRDIKPANILLDGRGEPLVSDFGIALAVQEAGGGRLTETGLSLGTPHYMSPEQATADRQVGPRSDVYALGCVLHEMLAGEPPFTGSSAQAVLARILTEDPRDLTAVRRSVPSNMAAAVARALEKLPADRFESAEAFVQALRDPGFTHAAGATASTGGTGAGVGPRARPAQRPVWAHPAVTAVLAVFVLVLGGVALTRTAGSGPESDTPPLIFAVPNGGDAFALDAGPDGTLVWVTARGRVMLRSPRAVQPRALDLPGDAGPRFVSMSPDGDRMAVAGAAGELGVYSLASREWDVIVESSGVSLGGVVAVDWTQDGWIYGVLAEREGPAVFRIRPSGGAREELWRLPPDAPFSPFFLEALPEGAGVLLTLVQQQPFDPHIVHLDPASGDTTTVVPANAGVPRWSATGHVVYISLDGGLWALPWDLDAREATGPAIRVIDDLGTERVPRYGLGPGGLLAYVRGPSFDVEEAAPGGDGIYFSLIDGDGGVTPLPLEPTDHPDATRSPDGSRIAYTRNNDILVFDLDIGSEWPLTRDSTGHHDPVWSPDGAFVAYQDHERRIAIRRSDGTGEARVLPFFGDTIAPSPLQWLEDGRLLVLAEDPGPGDNDIVALPVDGSAPPSPLLDGVWNETYAQVSPDGRWIGYISDRSGRPNLYVRRWPELDRERPVSREDQGVWTIARFAWSGEGDELVYANLLDRSLVGAVVDAAEPAEGGGRRVVLPVGGRIRGPAPDGRLLMLTAGFTMRGYNAEEELRVITDWRVLLAERQAEAGR